MNRLIKEKSLYLRQHATNPIDWYPWCNEAFEKAKKEDKPIFLSIGYSSCHWCHVMEKESFEDEEVAKILNENFVSIKVDREERPDIDSFYILVCQMMTGGAGWPLTIIMTPDKKVFFAGTYFPKRSYGGRPGLIDILKRVAYYWKNDRLKVERSAREIMESVRGALETRRGEVWDLKHIVEFYERLSLSFDEEWGGFGKGMKFPNAGYFLFLLNYSQKNSRALYMVEKTLLKMRLGGIFDHIGFGFMRYSVTPDWRLPHFEKMLYDNALLLLTYSHAYNKTRNEFFKRVSEEIWEYLRRDMMSADGVFYSSEDADSEGEEGKFYLWEIGEIRDVLGDDAEKFIRIFNIKEEGNFYDPLTGEKTGKNILYLSDVPDWDFFERARKKLFEFREKRKVRPQKDTKILCDWNSLLMKSLAYFSQKKRDVLPYAEGIAKFILSRYYDDNKGVLYHTEGVKGFLDDYAFFVWGLIELYFASFKTEYLKKAIEILDISIKRFYDSKDGAFFLSEDGEVGIKHKEFYDVSTPSGNSIQFINLYILSRITGNTNWRDMAFRLSEVFRGVGAESPFLLLGLLFDFLPSYEFIIIGNEVEDFINLINDFYLQKIIILKREKDDEIDEIVGFLKYMKVKKTPAVCVCKNYACDYPIYDIEELKNKLNSL